MNNSKTLFRDLAARIQTGDDNDEVQSIAYLILENLLSISKTDVLAARPHSLTPTQIQLMDPVIDRLNAGEPVQYILGHTEFCGRRYKVNPSVLIPRPETEELVQLALRHARAMGGMLSVLDIATGSGCIPISLFLDLPLKHVVGTDISADALLVAKENALRLGANVEFVEHDILKDPIPAGNWDIITSNPPYVTRGEGIHMKKNVLEHEPHLALFVPDEDPLRFYKAISQPAFDNMNPGGALILEINERYGRDIAELLGKSGFDVVILKDISQKDRIVRGIKPEN